MKNNENINVPYVPWNREVDDEVCPTKLQIFYRFVAPSDAPGLPKLSKWSMCTMKWSILSFRDGVAVWRVATKMSLVKETPSYTAICVLEYRNAD